MRALALGRIGDRHAVGVRDELGDQERRAVVRRPGGLAEPAAVEERARRRPRRAAAAARAGRTAPCRRSPTAGCRAARRRACEPRRPNHSGLPGLIRTRQKTSSTPQASKAGLTWSCGPTETPPETIRMSPCRPSSMTSCVRSAVVGDRRVVHEQRARLLHQRPDRDRVRLVDLARLGGAPGSSSSLPVTIRSTRGIRGTSTKPTPGGGERGQPRHGQDVAGPGQHVARVHVLAATADVQPGGDGRRWRRPCRRALGVLDAQDGVGAGRDRGAGRDPRGGPRLERRASSPPAARSPITRSSAPGATSAARTA